MSRKSTKPIDSLSPFIPVQVGREEYRSLEELRARMRTEAGTIPSRREALNILIQRAAAKLKASPAPAPFSL